MIGVVFALSLLALPQDDTGAPSAGRKTPPKSDAKGLALFQDEGGTHRIHLPANWKAEPGSGGVLALDVEAPGGSQARLLVERRDDLWDPRSAPRRWGDQQSKKETVYRPVPMYVESRGARSMLVAFRKIRGNGFVVSLDCAEGDVAAMRAGFVAAVRSFEADVPRFPEIPGNYALEEKGRFLYAVHPSVKGSLRGLQRIVEAQEKRFTAWHGALVAWEKDHPPVIFLRNDRAEVQALCTDAADRDFHAELQHRRLFAIPLPDGDSRVANLCAEVQALLFFLQYGDTQPSWCWRGETNVAFCEAYAGKPLPDVDPGMVQQLSGLRLLPLNALAPLEEKDIQAYMPQALAYTFFFRAGPGKYPKAYKAFLQEYRSTGDPDAAYARHIEALGLEKIRSAAELFVHRGLRPYEAKD